MNQFERMKDYLTKVYNTASEEYYPGMADDLREMRDNYPEFTNFPEAKEFKEKYFLPYISECIGSAQSERSGNTDEVEQWESGIRLTPTQPKGNHLWDRLLKQLNTLTEKYNKNAA